MRICILLLRKKNKQVVESVMAGQLVSPRQIHSDYHTNCEVCVLYGDPWTPVTICVDLEDGLKEAWHQTFLGQTPPKAIRFLCETENVDHAVTRHGPCVPHFAVAAVGVSVWNGNTPMRGSLILWLAPNRQQIVLMMALLVGVSAASANTATPTKTCTPGFNPPPGCAYEGPPSPTPRPTHWSDDGCDPNDPTECKSGFCTNNVCCTSATCPDPERCDIAGHHGTCHAPLSEGEPCATNTDCEDPLVCRFDPVSDLFVCAVPPQPTPTLLPTPPPSPTAGAIVCVCRQCGPGQCHDFYGGCYPCLPPTSCPGDCGGDGAVSVDDIVSMVNLALSDAFPDCPVGCDTCKTCEAGDTLKDCQITVDEIIQAVNSALNGCPAVQTCGGIAGIGCPSGEYCEFPQKMCAVADLAGECRPRPICDDGFAPVCGCDHQTYSNDCERALAGVARDYVGVCNIFTKTPKPTSTPPPSPTLYRL